LSVRTRPERQRQAVEQNSQNNHRDRDVRPVSLEQERQQRQCHPRHRSRDQQNQAELDQRLRARVSQAPQQKPHVLQIGRFAAKLTVPRRGRACDGEPPDSARQHHGRRNQHSRPKQRSYHLFQPLVGHRNPPENPL
jgi:hypothetical protein